MLSDFENFENIKKWTNLGRTLPVGFYFIVIDLLISKKNMKSDHSLIKVSLKRSVAPFG